MAKKLVLVTATFNVEADYYVWVDDNNEDEAVGIAESAEVLSTCYEFQDLNHKKENLDFIVGEEIEDPSFISPELILNPEDAPPDKEQHVEAQVQWQESGEEP